ncbi:SRPBCC family protein [Allorhizocola rhizosphaerae]|uniref:SRPBCC family protein n=1 Tax=Allorhizocola rhizosphaerae TaxID=1872709 RepID=UPI000E3CFD17|nr:SRPBCC family protein [Allorhizocola rhizosphaerae]
MRWQHTITISAPVRRVWELTLDVEGWPGYTPTMQRVERLDSGPIAVGSSARIKQPGQAAAIWTVTRLEPEREFTWQTKRMGITMTGSHLLAPTADGCRNTLVLEITGFGARLLGLVAGRALADALAKENHGFKKAAESLEV